MILTWTCQLDPEHVLRGNFDDMITHLADVHGEHVERWPDGAPVVDMSDVPELL